jgi:hypothetical protein
VAGDEDQRVTEAGGAEDVREHEDEARRARTDAEAERAAAERDAEEAGPPEADDDSIVPMDSDAERRGVMPPPAGAGGH